MASQSFAKACFVVNRQLVNFFRDIANFFILGAVLGPLALAYAIGQTTQTIVTQVYDQNRSLGQAFLGAAADTTGLTTLYAGVTKQDIISGDHLGLSDAQRRQMITEGTFQVGMTVYGAANAANGVRNNIRNRQAAANTPPIQNAPPAAGARPVPPPEVVPPPRTTTGSNAGSASSTNTAAAQVHCPCFPAGTPIRTLAGSKLIENIQAGDIVLSRHEDRPDGPVAGKVVEEVFVRVSPLLRLVIGDREIRVTPEHPFYAEGRGWIATGLLEVGDKLHTLEGERLAVRLVEETGEVKTVYNFRVAEFSTYFLGADDWRFAIWTHMAYRKSSATQHRKYKPWRRSRSSLMFSSFSSANS